MTFNVRLFKKHLNWFEYIALPFPTDAVFTLSNNVLSTSQYSRQYGESLMRHNWFEPISASRGLKKPASRLTNLGESNWLHWLPE